jgi:hypothetical protein
MSAFGIDVFNFEFWQGPPPPIPSQKVVVSHRPGVSGTAHQLLGTWGDTFDVAVTSHWATFLDAMSAHNLMTLIIGTGGVPIKFNNINWTSMYGVLYHVEAVEMIDLHAAIWLIGPGYSYANGASMTTRISLTPQKV